MLDFQKLIVYQKARALNADISQELQSIKRLNRNVKDQLERALLSIVLNISEGAGKKTSQSKKNFYSIARGSTFEAAATLEFLKDINMLSEERFKQYISQLEELSKMLYGLMNSTRV